MIGVIVAMALAVQALLRTLRETRAPPDPLRGEAVPLWGELRDTGERAGVEVDRVDDLLDTAEAISATVDSASRLGYLAFRAPVIRTVALGKGIGRGARRLVGRPGPPALGPTSGRPRRGLPSGDASRSKR